MLLKKCVALIGVIYRNGFDLKIHLTVYIVQAFIGAPLYYVEKSTGFGFKIE